MKITAQVPVKLVNGLNTREHHMARHRRAVVQRSAAKLALYKACKLIDFVGEPVTITITRRGGRRMDDDGLTASAKHVRDGVADWLGIDDGDPRLTWVVKQDGAPRGKHWVDVEVAA
jgi:hypothetical protein